MPYSIRKSGNKFQIIKTSTGKVVGTSTSRAKAQASINARNAGEHGWKPSKKKSTKRRGKR